MTKTIISDREYNEIMLECLLSLMSRVNLSNVFDVNVLSRGNVGEMCRLFEKCVKKDNMREFIKYYRVLRKVETKVKKTVVKKTVAKKTVATKVVETVSEEEDEDSSSDYVPEYEDSSSEDEDEK